MSHPPVNPTRRRFVSQVMVAAGCTALGGTLCERARAAELPPLKEDDPLGGAMNYKADTTKVDAKKFPAHKPTQTCESCRLFQGGAGAAGPCQIFPGKSVAAKGWCQVWTAKT